MTDETYNGWPNRETWLAALWLQNDEAVAWTVSDLGREALARYPDDADFARMEYARLLEGTFDLLGEDIITSLPGLYRDLLGTAFHRVDWDTLARTWLEDFVEAE